MQTGARNRRLRFAQFEIDLDAQELRRDGRPVRIQPQPLRVLEILIERARNRGQGSGDNLSLAIIKLVEVEAPKTAPRVVN